MDDETLTFVAITIELGLPVALVTLFVHRPTARRRVVVMLGSVTPAILFYLSGAAIAMFGSGRWDLWAFGAMWEMTLAPYIAIALVGWALCMLPRPNHLVGRYCVGLGAVPVGYGLLVLTGRIVSAA